MITWKITDTTSEDGVVTSAKYFVTAVDGGAALVSAIELAKEVVELRKEIELLKAK